jgi:hypothetical protein
MGEHRSTESMLRLASRGLTIRFRVKCSAEFFDQRASVIKTSIRSSRGTTYQEGRT